MFVRYYCSEPNGAFALLPITSRAQGVKGTPTRTYVCITCLQQFASALDLSRDRMYSVGEGGLGIDIRLKDDLFSIHLSALDYERPRYTYLPFFLLQPKFRLCMLIFFQ